MWGPPTLSRQILINGELYNVGQNLFDFLDSYRLTKAPQSQFLWIDAICIAQEDVQERNHQVMQMGEIFSTAGFVYVWLGRNTAAAWCVQKFRAHQEGPRMSKKAAMAGRAVFPWLYHNEYWSRAWVTQELILARKLVVLLDEESVPLPELFAMLEWGHYLDHDYHNTPLGRHLPVINGTEKIAGIGLVSLINRFHDKRCGIALDRIFCLNALCSASSQVGVDYGKEPSELAYEVLSKVENLCVCDIAVVLLALNLIPGPATGNVAQWSSNLHVRVRVPNGSLGFDDQRLASQTNVRIRCQTIADLVPSRLSSSHQALQPVGRRHFPKDMTLDTQARHHGSSAIIIPFVSLAVFRPAIQICSERSRKLPF
ncbi:hypothetical protein E8E12_004837 [Didymella heteroderae]|uniref:Heterokaryon incompatibility domain-containing protein n=1 Tax=Didymella heteroderae TaxID=1769908 RepID=A0A9P4WN64_9PLEO|nr:hypothetical protein E8E12_004837 [Didymella heteroderae]